MMKRFLKTVMALMMLSLTGAAMHAMSNVSNSATVTTTVVKTQTNTEPDNDPYHREENDRGNRAPSCPISCTIDSATGIEFFGQETPDFVLYEIYNSNNACVGAYGDESEFLTALFSMTGEYRISLSTAEVSYIGYVAL